MACQEESVEFNISIYVENFSENFLISLEKRISEVVKKCGIKVKTCNVLKSGDKLMHSVSLREKLLFQIEYIGECSYFNSVPEAYSSIQRNWSDYVAQIFKEADNRPWLNFRTDKSFNKKFVIAHRNIGLLQMNLGTLVSRSHFISHCRKEYIEADFFHDSRKIVIANQMELKYTSIKHILVNGNQWIIHLLHPPICYRSREKMKFRVPYLVDFHSSVLGRCNALLLVFTNMHVENNSHNVLARLHFCFRNLGIQINFVNCEVTHKDMSLKVSSINFGLFEVNYLVEAILRRSFVPELQNFQDFIKTVRNLKAKNYEILQDALKELIYLNDSGFIFNFNTALKLLFDEMQRRKKNISVLDIIPEKTKLVRRAMITPTKVVLFPPELIITNRIVRKFDIDSSLRISFRDDDTTKLCISNGNINCKDVIKDTVNSIRDGLTIGGRKYEFLAWSNSQIRDHGLWMYAQDDDLNTAHDIRKWMGDFSKIRCVAKFAARMGQCFSQTEETVTVPLDEGRIRVEPDIEGCEKDPESKNPYCFSDGIGRISQSLAEKVCKELNVEKIRSAYQIRYSGFKGMLAIDPELKECDIVFRDSMKKFECINSQVLEIVKIAQAGPVHLNRPLITILDQLGVKHWFFLKIQNEAIQNYTEMFLDDQKACAYLSMHNNLMNVNFNDFVDYGLYPTVEPFFRNLLLTGHRFDISQIVKKARIPIQPEDGRNMFGVLDETGKLEYGQIFVQYTTYLVGQETNQDKKIVTGKVMVTKNPCYQLGDVRVLDAIDVPELHHIVDCIVFPQKGKRPHPNEMSGSDLDGDEYTVIWKKDLIFSRNKRPRHCPVPEKNEIDRKVQISDLFEFFCNFIMNDRIGVLANSHLAAADRVGLHNGLCNNIARNCSIAVDFAKSGVSKESEELFFNVKFYPDFMEKWDKITYRSNRALGKLYRSSRICARLNPKTPGFYENIKVDPLFNVPGWEKYKTRAIQSRDNYNSFLESILTGYGIISEAEAMTGLYTKIHGRFSMKNSRNEIEELVKILIKSLWQRFKQDFYDEFREGHRSSDNEKFQEEHKKAAAWYNVTYSQENPKYLSFPWVVTELLLQVRFLNQTTSTEEYGKQPIYSELECYINQELSRKAKLQYNGLKSNFDKAEYLIKMWLEHNNFDYSNILKLFSSAIGNSLDYDNSISYVFVFFKYVIKMSLQENNIITDTLKVLGLEHLINLRTILRLGKEALITYERIAICKDFAPFGLSRNQSPNEMVEMTKTITEDVIEKSDLKKLIQLLRRYCNVEIFGRRENGVVLSAIGPYNDIQNLEEMLQNGSEGLKKALESNNYDPFLLDEL